MHAVIVSDYGASPVVAELPTPVAGPGEVLIKLAAAGMNPMDVELASGKWRPEPATFPMVLGVDGAGTVDALRRGSHEVLSGRANIRSIARCPDRLGRDLRANMWR